MGGIAQQRDPARGPLCNRHRRLDAKLDNDDISARSTRRRKSGLQSRI